ncbi:hypothetical protein Thiowin_04965 [Thiorhodovibrio winogradskyi]|uniref:Uncharacterized protein n=1 Tax=Thiorhodovibrio winogradskyi TaxID=77007 RepID=A0ABZ0S8H6_9GAMM|nr:hypothetical protein Thiosp_03045 [Thiorhodovibrio litoralis]
MTYFPSRCRPCRCFSANTTPALPGSDQYNPLRSQLSSLCAGEPVPGSD